jgi:hypothetical protein
MYEDFSPQNEQHVLVRERMSDSMSGVIRWIKVTSLCAVIAVVLTLATSAVVLSAEWTPGGDAGVIDGFIAVMMTVINYVFVFIYIFGSVTVFYFLRYMYLDYLLKKARPVSD